MELCVWGKTFRNFIMEQNNSVLLCFVLICFHALCSILLSHFVHWIVLSAGLASLTNYSAATAI